jgi:hypothetical protein
MAKGKIPGLRNVSMHQARKLLKLPSVADEALSAFGPAHVLSDGRVLVYTSGDVYGRLYPSREVLEEVNRGLAETEREAAEQKAAGCPDPCLTLLPPIDDFIRDVDLHANSLGKAIKVKDEALLDRSVASLDAVDKALTRIPRAKRPVPEILTPLMAYVGEVMRRACGGRWTKSPEPQTKEQVYIFDPAELMAHWAAKRKLQPIANAAADKAAAEARARGASAHDVEVAAIFARRAAFAELEANGPRPIRVEDRKDNEPVITASNGQILRPFVLLFLPMIEPDRYRPLRIAVESDLHGAGYPQAPKPSA